MAAARLNAGFAAANARTGRSGARRSGAGGAATGRNVRTNGIVGRRGERVAPAVDLGAHSSHACAALSADQIPRATSGARLDVVARAIASNADGQEEHRIVRASAASSGASPASAAPVQWKGAKLKPLSYSLLTGVIIWFCPTPAGVTAQAWHLLAIFLATIVGIITQPLPLGAVAFMGLGATLLTGTLKFAQAFSAFSSEIPWLIALAFFFSRGFIKTGLGNRIAYYIVSAFGSTTLGLTYSLVFAEALLAPAIPSLAARAGGIFLPLCKALAQACGSNPDDGTAKKMGAYLMVTCFQTSTITSAMFITAMAANPLSVNLAAAAIGHTITWGQWALAASVPGLVCLIAVPLLLYVFYPPEVKDSPEAPVKAREELKKLGPMSADEKIMSVALAITVGLWIFGPAIGVGSVAAALLGLSILLVSGVITWKECLAEGAAWDTLSWFAALIAMAAFLSKFGLISWFSNNVVTIVSNMGLGWQPAFLITSLLYFYSHYLFASGAAHIGAMYTAFLSVATACGTPPVMAALVLGFFSNLMGCTTHYGIGSAPPYFGTGYVPLPTWWTIGACLSVFYIAVFFGIGFPWWSILGLM